MPEANGAVDQRHADLDYWEQTINEHEAARFLGLSRKTLLRLGEIGRGPPRFELSPRRHGFTRRGCANWRQTTAAA